jgi:hypothetical protein
VLQRTANARISTACSATMCCETPMAGCSLKRLPLRQSRTPRRHQFHAPGENPSSNEFRVRGPYEATSRLKLKSESSEEGLTGLRIRRSYGSILFADCATHCCRSSKSQGRSSDCVPNHFARGRAITWFTGVRLVSSPRYVTKSGRLEYRENRTICG